MSFWIFMLLMNLLFPLTMVGFGHYFVKNAGPKAVNWAFGYRTSMSMKNMDTWRFAHVYCGRLWRILGWAILPISIIFMLFLINKDEDTIGTYGCILNIAQLVVLVYPIFPTERALRKRFDKNGNIREQL